MASNKLQLYFGFRSSCSWRVRIAMALKGVTYDGHPIDLRKNENMTILEYLEEAYPQPPLLPKDTLLRAKVREICELVNSGIQPIQGPSLWMHFGEETCLERSNFNITKGFTALERVLAGCSGKYCVGDNLTLADCFIVPQVYNAVIRFNVDMKPFPTINRVNASLITLEAFKSTHPDVQPSPV
ncbi:probable maleylacetoacetate isomerase 2 isoform X2 [Procambarus clarkii]|uniref:probable maleylacetoacetate isomerase 2 isoform X2 n=1 Tax=Procambarus clarkii TaxID=6728 RepID=UPI003743330D